MLSDIYDIDDPIELNKKQEIEQPTYLDAHILEKFNQIHNYMYQRKLTDEVINKFKIGYNITNNSITFPVWDINGNLLGITERSVDKKYFYIPENLKKPIYLLNYIVKENIKSVIVCESQIDALTAWSYGYPAIATMGSPSTKQINLINKSGIRHLILMFDNDAAGERFSEKLKKNLRSDIFISEVNFPAGVKDINDLTKDQFEYMIKNLK